MITLLYHILRCMHSVFKLEKESSSKKYLLFPKSDGCLYCFQQGQGKAADKELQKLVRGDRKRFALLRENTLPYREDRLLESALKVLQKGQIGSILEVIDYVGNVLPFSTICAIIHVLQQDSCFDLTEAVYKVCRVSSIGRYRDVVTKYAITFFMRACSENEEEEAYVKLGGLFKVVTKSDMAGCEINWDTIIGPISMVYILSYCVKYDAVNSLDELSKLVSRNSRAHLYLAIDVLTKKRNIFKINELSKENSDRLKEKSDYFNELKKTLKIDYDEEIQMNSIEINGEKMIVRTPWSEKENE